MNRQEFSTAVRKIIKAESGPFCSRPSCRQYLQIYSEPDNNDARLYEVAHIHAASPGGPRFDPNMTAEETGHADNAILLCPTCHTEIDRCPQLYTAQVVRAWKYWARSNNNPQGITALTMPGDGLTVMQDCQQGRRFLEAKRDQMEEIRRFLNKAADGSVSNHSLELALEHSLPGHQRFDTAILRVLDSLGPAVMAASTFIFSPLLRTKIREIQTLAVATERIARDKRVLKLGAFRSADHELIYQDEVAQALNCLYERYRELQKYIDDLIDNHGVRF